MKSPAFLAGIIGVAVLAAGFGAWWLFNLGIKPSLEASSQGEASTPFTEPLTKTYKNEAFRFSLMMPDGFSATELPPDASGASQVILQDSKGDGIQVTITPSAEDQKTLTADDIRSSLPDMEVSEVQNVDIGEYHGVAFLSDNQAFSGASREVWFYFRGNLYQVSTYARLDGLLKAMFATWKFY